MSYVNHLPAVSPLSHAAGPSHLGGYQTPGDTVFPQSPKSPGQDNPSNPPGWYTAPASAESPYRNHSPSLRLPASGEVGPSRPPAIYPTARHQPYPQSRPHLQGLCIRRPPVRDQFKGKGREIPLAAMNYGPLTPKTPSWGNSLEVCPNTLRCCARVTRSASLLSRPPDPIMGHSWSHLSTRTWACNTHDRSSL